MYDNLAELKAGDEAANARGASVRDFGGSDHDVTEEEVREAQESINNKLRSARRLLLAEISDDPDKRAAWEVLAGPVDWEKAKKFEPQDNEPYPPRMRKADMLLTAEAGWLGEMTGGRDKKAELMEAAEEYRATGREDGPAFRRILAKE